MDSVFFWERNLSALSRQNPELCLRLKSAAPGAGRYVFLRAASGETIPAPVDGSGVARPLHSTVNPKREAERLVSAINDGGAGATGFVVFLGLGGGFAPAAALELPGVSGVLAIEYGLAGVAELLRARDYSALFADPRFTLLADPAPELVENAVAELYRPALSGGIRVLPLRARVERDRADFGAAGDAVRRGVEKVSADYSVQAHFGRRWFANIVRNIASVQNGNGDFVAKMPPVCEAAICAAGPSLDAQIPLLLERKRAGEGGGLFVVSTDTALPALVRRGLKPDAVVSIDCQHVSYHHFMDSVCAGIPLFMDIAGPPMLSSLSDSAVFFSGGHPLALYLRQKWRPLPVLDTSGGNVAFACLSLAESLGARRITVCGADFSYPRGKIYARGTYVFPYFEKRQNRFSALEAQASAFLYRAPFLPAETDSASGARKYETATMRSYRRSFEEKISGMEAEVSVMPGLGIPPSVFKRGRPRPPANAWKTGTAEKPAAGAAEFLETYRRDVAALPPAGNPRDSGAYLRNPVFTTLLPLMAAFKRREPEMPPSELLEAVKLYCVGEIDGVLNRNYRAKSAPA